MEICTKNLLIACGIVVLICYLFYTTACSNQKMQIKLALYNDKFGDIDKELKKTNKKEKDIIPDRDRHPNAASVIKKGVGALAKSNNLTEIPKFLDV
jgi:hypothetical protein